MKKSEKRIAQLVTPSQPIKKQVDGAEVSLEELESLCNTFGRRPRGCSGFYSTSGSDDILF